MKATIYEQNEGWWWAEECRLYPTAMAAKQAVMREQRRTQSAILVTCWKTLSLTGATVVVAIT